MIDWETMELTELGKEVCTWIGTGITILISLIFISAIIIIMIYLIKWLKKNTK